MFGLSENDANLLWSPGAIAIVSGRAGGSVQDRERIARARAELTALRPTYVRLLIDWAALQPDPRRPPALEGRVSGCDRGIGPCVPYAGFRDRLEAIASQQRAFGRGAFQPVIVIYGTPAWAARPPSGCESSSSSAFSRAPTGAGILAYRALIRALLGVSARAGVALEWWSPWNEPNDASFLGPQRPTCGRGTAALASPSPAAQLYGELARAMADELKAAGGQRHLLLGELNAFQSDAPDRTSIGAFVAALRADVACMSDTWSLHAYAARGPYAPAVEPVGLLESTLDARGGCGRGAEVWVTEAGAGAPHPGSRRLQDTAEEVAGCQTLAAQLAAWRRDPRVGAVFQYSFREDPAYPVGLLGPALDRTYLTYRLWLQWSRARAAGGVSSASGACS